MAASGRLEYSRVWVTNNKFHSVRNPRKIISDCKGLTIALNWETNLQRLHGQRTMHVDTAHRVVQQNDKFENSRCISLINISFNKCQKTLSFWFKEWKKKKVWVSAHKESHLRHMRFTLQFSTTKLRRTCQWARPDTRFTCLNHPAITTRINSVTPFLC